MAKDNKSIIEQALTNLAYAGKLKFEGLRKSGGPDFYLTPIEKKPSIQKLMKATTTLMLMQRIQIIARKHTESKNKKQENQQIFNTWQVTVYKENIKTVPMNIMHL